MNRLKKELSRMKALKVELEQRLQISEAYREFMRSVVESSNGEFEDIPHVMARYEELKRIRKEQVIKTVKQVETAFLLENELKEIVQVHFLQKCFLPMICEMVMVTLQLLYREQIPKAFHVKLI